MGKSIKVTQLDKNKSVINVFDSIAEAAEHAGVNESTIRYAIKHDVLRVGYYWTNAEETDESFVLEEQKNDNGSSIHEFKQHLKKVGVEEEDIKSVKFWQTQSGELRYSIVKNFDSTQDDKENQYNRIVETLQKAIKPFQLSVKPIKVHRGLFVNTADKHIGSSVPEYSLYDNDYTALSFEERMQGVVNLILKQYEVYGTFDTIFLNDLGDPLDGYNGYTTRRKHKLPQNMDNEEAFDTYLEVHKRFFDTLIHSEVANHYVFNAVTNDNHSGAFGYCAHRALETYLNVKYPQVQTFITKRFITHFHYGNHTIMLCHGKDSEDMNSGLPLHLDAKTDNYIGDYIKNYKLSGKNLHFIKGDLHQAASQVGKTFRYRNCMSIFGASNWIQNNFGNTKPGISIDILDKYGDEVVEINKTF